MEHIKLVTREKAFGIIIGHWRVGRLPTAGAKTRSAVDIARLVAFEAAGVEGRHTYVRLFFCLGLSPGPTCWLCVGAGPRLADQARPSEASAARNICVLSSNHGPVLRLAQVEAQTLCRRRVVDSAVV